MEHQLLLGYLLVLSGVPSFAEKLQGAHKVPAEEVLHARGGTVRWVWLLCADRCQRKVSSGYGDRLHVSDPIAISTTPFSPLSPSLSLSLTYSRTIPQDQLISTFTLALPHKIYPQTSYTRITNIIFLLKFAFIGGGLNNVVYLDSILLHISAPV